MNFRNAFARYDKSLSKMLGDSAVLDVAGDASNTQNIQGYFDAPWIEPRVGTLRTDVLEPQFAVEQSVNLSGLVKGTSRLTFAGESYTVIDAQPDSTGLTVLVLRAVQ